METRACRTGSSVFAAAAAIGELPKPDSLESNPRETPICIAICTPAPAKPPAAATGVNACTKINVNAWGIFL